MADWIKVTHTPNAAYMAESLRARYPVTWTDSRAFAEWGSTFDVTSFPNDVPQVLQYRVQIESDGSRTLYRRVDIGTLDDQGRIIFPSDARDSYNYMCRSRTGLEPGWSQLPAEEV